MNEDYRKPFIPIWMDQAGFTPHQFRVLAHLWSRGQGKCFPSLETIAACCGMKKITVINAIKEMEFQGYVTRQKRKSKGIRFANEYILTGPKGAPVKNEQVQKGHRLTGPKGAPANRSIWGTGNDTSENDSSENETSLFCEDVLPMAESVPSSKKANPLQELAESIYQEYPKKEAKKPAIESILKAMKKNRPAFLLEKTKEYATAISWKDKTYIPQPAKWFKDERFNDDPETWRQPTTTSTTSGAVNLGGRAYRKNEYPQESLELPD